jgi:hypothetical protein
MINSRFIAVFPVVPLVLVAATPPRRGSRAISPAADEPRFSL